jgi:5-(carboxyamino)imidazole ribonucleotide synthase
VRNRHEDGILRESRVPSAAPRSTIEAATAAAQNMAEALDYIGVFAVEFFVLKDGRIAVNEMAPRVHNSGHWTIDACRTDQFEQHIRAVCGLPLGPVERHSDVMMENLLGDEIDAWPALLADPAAKLHLYGKSEARPGRKMGHVTRLSPRS